MRHIVITGFMGTGKTTVGRRVARKLCRSFVDMDEEIEKRAGKPIPHIFAENGEEAFRQMEGTLCQELCAASEPLVIATGGGTLVDSTNRALMLEHGTVICLRCDVDEILRRVEPGQGERPLLNVPDPRSEIQRLLTARRAAYDAMPWQLDTTNQTVEEITEHILYAAHKAQFTLTVHYPGGTYPLYIGDDMLSQVGALLHETELPARSRVALVTNTVVDPLYSAQVESVLREAGFHPFVCTLPDGEQYKTLETVAKLYEQFLAGSLDRSGIVLSLGGGVTGDIAGFAAATFMRGVRFVQIPTTLLSMVDASVGGKTGVDLPQGKNLVGAFKQPAMVVIDPTVLNTLPVEEIRAGMAEVIKHGMINDQGLLAELEAGVGCEELTVRSSLLARAVQVKIDIVEVDPFEQGRRAVLNLGHTVGHALEKLSGFELRHGEAVSIGMVAALHLAVARGYAQPSLVARLETLLSTWELPIWCPPFEVDAIWQAMAHDKKRRGAGLRWILPRAVGYIEIVENVPEATVRSVLRELGAVT